VPTGQKDRAVAKSAGTRRTERAQGGLCVDPEAICARVRLREACWRKKKNIALSELGSEDDRLRRQRAHDVARTLESLHVAGSDVDPETMAIGQRYVDGEISSDELTAAIGARLKDVSSRIWRDDSIRDESS
jgi:hypothetical protein